MAIIDINFSPSQRQLRQFGLVCLVALPLITWFWAGSSSAVGWAGIVGAVLCGLGFVAPNLLKPVFLGLTIVTLPIGLVVGEVAMLLLYFGLFFPMAVALRLAGRDALQRRNQTSRETFWQKRKQNTAVRSYYHQF